ncbi:MAG: hypothetical protein ACLGG6_09665 [Gammaproteobacteria bacterium]
MQEGKARARMAHPAPERAPELPDLRRRIVIEDWDFGHRVHVMELHRTARRDCYRVTVDGKPWKARIGWSKILEGLRKSLPRVGAE